ncbi:MAG: hypothetical protein ABI461_21315 [Polyangiaceae bacterium]
MASLLTACAAGPLEEARSLPDAPRPTMMPEVTHSDGEVTLEQTSGSVTPRGFGNVGHLPIQLTRLAVEQPIVSRLVFVGGTYQGAFGSPSSAQDPKVIGGNLELYGRAIWATRTGLAFGGGLGFMLPTAQFERGSSVNNLARAAIALRPWDYMFFNQGIFGVRPFLDLRYIIGPVILQVRETFDGNFDVENKNDLDVDVVGTFFVAVRVRKDLAAGVELGELYRITADIPDNERANWTVSPMIRLILPRLQPALSAMTNLSDPYYTGANRIWAVKTTLTALW